MHRDAGAGVYHRSAMPFSTPRNAATSYLVLRHLYEGDVVEWPLPEDHPQKRLFDALEAQGFVARWDRVWPLSDRYRLTERGIGALEAVYRPADAEAFYERIRAQNLPPAGRRAALAQARLDPVVWPILHDPFTHWSTVDADQGRYYRYFWEDQRPPLRVPPPPKQPAQKAPKPQQGGGVRVVRGGGFHVHQVHHHDHHDNHQRAVLVDLDRDAGDPDYIPPDQGDVDVS
jgi:hypothetical protein